MFLGAADCAGAVLVVGDGVALVAAIGVSVELMGPLKTRREQSNSNLV